MDILQIIIENGLSVRQIPAQEREKTSFEELYYQNQLKKAKNDSLFEVAIEIHKPDLSYFENLSYISNPQKALESFYKNFPDGRKYIVITKEPKFGGYWMCQRVGHNSSKVEWNLKVDNLAPTLEESVGLWVKNKAL